MQQVFSKNNKAQEFQGYCLRKTNTMKMVLRKRFASKFLTLTIFDNSGALFDEDAFLKLLKEACVKQNNTPQKIIMTLQFKENHLVLKDLLLPPSMESFEKVCSLSDDWRQKEKSHLSTTKVDKAEKQYSPITISKYLS